MDSLISENAKKLEFRSYPTTTWSGPFASKNMETGEIKHGVDIGSHVPTGFFA